MNIKINGITYRDVAMERALYSNGRLAILFRDASSGEPIIKATVNLVDEKMGDDEVALSHEWAEAYSELLILGIVSLDARTARPAGSYVDFIVATLSAQFMNGTWEPR